MSRYQLQVRRSDTYDLWLTLIGDDGELQPESREIVSIDTLPAFLGASTVDCLGHGMSKDNRFWVQCTCDPRPMNHVVEFEINEITRITEAE